MIKHTPGPWKFEVATENSFCSRTGARQKPNYTCWVRSADGEQSVTLVSTYGVPFEANARLIAAAPEMFEALKEYAQLFEIYSMQGMTPEVLQGELDPEVFNSVMEKRKSIYTLIAKAEGRSK